MPTLKRNRRRIKRPWASIVAVLLFHAALFPAVACAADAGAGGKAEKAIHLSCPEEQWYPFLYTENGEGKGMMIDVVKKAFENIGIKAKIEVYPLNRCIRMAEYGKTDGIIGLPYDKRFATAVEYPPESPAAAVSVWRILQIDEVVVTYADGDYEYEGNIRSLPEPVRVAQGSPLASELKQAGIAVEEVATYRQLFSKLIRDKKGCLVVNSLAAEIYQADESFRGVVEIHATPLRSSSYYLAFSWQSGLTKDEREMVWREVKRWRQDYAFMLRVFSQY